MKNKYREALKKIKDSLSPEEKTVDLMLDRLYRLILKGKIGQANLIAKAIKVVSPKTKEVVISNRIFEAYWKSGRYKDAIKAYVKGGRPFWLAQEVGQYYEKNGQIDKAMKEYNLVIDVYLKKKGFLPLPKGPVELYKLGKWYIKRNPRRAKKLLKLYLQAEKSTDPAAPLRLKHKRQAEELLSNLA